VVYFLKTSKITLTNKHKAVETKTLKEIRWITKNMMNVEIIFGILSFYSAEGGSKLLKIRDVAFVAKWVEPVCLNLQKVKDIAGI